MHEKEVPTPPAAEPRAPVDVESAIKLLVVPEDGGFVITSSGMHKFDRPEIMMQIRDGHFLTSGCNIMNEVAQYLIHRSDIPQDGQRVQLAQWTVVQFQKRTIDDTLVIEVVDGTDIDQYN